MVIASSLFAGAVFIIALGSWFAVTVASLTGISNVDKDFFEAARTLGRQQKAAGVPGGDSPRHAVDSAGLYPGHELFLRGSYDRGDAGRKGRTWLVYDMADGLGQL